MRIGNKELPWVKATELLPPLQKDKYGEWKQSKDVLVRWRFTGQGTHKPSKWGYRLGHLRKSIAPGGNPMWKVGGVIGNIEVSHWLNLVKPAECRRVKKIKKKYEGFYTKDNKPEPGTLKRKEAKELCRLLRLKERKARIIIYKKPIKSALTKEELGFKEFEYEGWIWPIGLASHYIRKHKVKPSPAFIKWLQPIKYIK